MADHSNNRAPRFPYPRGNPQPQPRIQPQPESRGSANDPLSELARLIGQTDPFAETPRPPRSERSTSRNESWPGNAPPQNYSTGLPPLMPEYRDEPPHRQEDYAAQPHQPYVQPQHGQEQYQQPYDEAAYPEPGPQHYGAPYAQGHDAGPYYDEHGQVAGYDSYEDQYRDEARRPRRRRNGLVTAIVLVCLAVLGTAGAYAYRAVFHGSPSGPPPLIKADTGPSKVVPAQSSADNSAGKQIYDRVGSTSAGQDEKIVSREEQPVDVRTAGIGAVASGGGGPQTIAGVLGNQPPGGFSGTSPRQPAAGAQSEPHRVRTVTIRPDQQGSTQARTATPAQNTAAPAPRHIASAPADIGNAPLSLTPGAGATASTGSPARGGYMVQISAQKSQAEATAAFNAAKVKYSNLLGSYQVVLRKKEIAGKGTFYGAQVGPFATREDAAGLCSHLKSAGGNCLVEKN